MDFFLFISLLILHLRMTLKFLLSFFAVGQSQTGRLDEKKKANIQVYVQIYTQPLAGFSEVFFYLVQV